MSQVAFLMQTLGRLEAKLEAGFQEVHRRLDTQDRSYAEWRRYMLRRMDTPRKKSGSNGHVKLRYLQLIAALCFVIAGTLGYKQPLAFRETITAIAAKVTLGLIGGS